MPLRDLGPHALIVDEGSFALVTELELRKAMRLQYPVSMLAILPEPEGAGEISNPGHLAEQLAQVTSRLIRSMDLIRLQTSSSSLHVLLIDAHLEHLHIVTERITEEVSRYPFQVSDERKAVTLSVGGGCFPTTARTSEELMAQTATLAREVRSEAPGRSRHRFPGTARSPGGDDPGAR